MAIGWLISATIYLLFRDGAGPLLAFQMSLMGLLFYYLWKNAKPNNRRFFQILFWLHFLYFASGSYRMFGEWFFPETLAASYTFYQTIGNGIYIATLVFLFGFSAFRMYADWRYGDIGKNFNDSNDPQPKTPPQERRTPPTVDPRHRWLVNILIRISNDEKPDSEHIPLLEKEENKTSGGVKLDRRRIVNKIKR